MISLIGLAQSGVKLDSFDIMPVHQDSRLVLDPGEEIVWRGDATGGTADSVIAATASKSDFTRLWQVSQPLTVTVTTTRTVYRVRNTLSLQMGVDVELEGAATALKRTRFRRPNPESFVAAGQVRHSWLMRVDSNTDAGEVVSLLSYYTAKPAVFLRIRLLIPGDADNVARTIVRNAARERLQACSTLSDIEDRHIQTLREQSTEPKRHPGLWGEDYLLPYGYAIGRPNLPYVIEVKRQQG